MRTNRFISTRTHKQSCVKTVPVTSSPLLYTFHLHLTDVVFSILVFHTLGLDSNINPLSIVSISEVFIHYQVLILVHCVCLLEFCSMVTTGCCLQFLGTELCSFMRRFLQNFYRRCWMLSRDVLLNHQSVQYIPDKLT